MNLSMSPCICGKVGALLLLVGSVGSFAGDKVHFAPMIMADGTVPAPPNARTLMEWMPWLVAGGFMLIATQVAKAISAGVTSAVDLYISGRKKIRDADSETAQAKLEACEKKLDATVAEHKAEILQIEARHELELKRSSESCTVQIRDQQEAIRHKDAEIASSYVRIAQREREIESHMKEKERLMENNILLVDRLSDLTKDATRTNNKLTDQIIKSASSVEMRVPPEIRINADGPIPVKQADLPLPVTETHAESH